MSAVRVRVTGAVQGVGFRPFCYSEAARCGLAGFVLNDLGGVEIVLEGPRERIESFLEALRTNPPPAARIRGIDIAETAEQGFKDFTIRTSTEGQASQALEVAADIATCAKCAREIGEAGDRRAGYAFTNCTDCGPRYTIIDKLPYDRPLTTMGEFHMCADCLREYEDPGDRRFHAQPNACPRCGPELVLLDSRGRVVPTSDVISEAAGLLVDGRILAVKGLGGYHLMCDASNIAAIEELRRRKTRPTKALALMARDIVSARMLARIEPEEEEILSGQAAPIVLMGWRDEVPEELRQAIAPRNPGVGIMLAYTPLHHLLFQAMGQVTSNRDPQRNTKCLSGVGGGPQKKAVRSFGVRERGPQENVPHFLGVLVATSANRGDEPLIAEEGELYKKLSGVFDFALVHNRRILNRIDDSIVFFLKESSAEDGTDREVTPTSNARQESGPGSPREYEVLSWGKGVFSRSGRFYLVRRARGFAPEPFQTGFDFPRALAVGAEMKGSFAISDGAHLWLSPHIGELTNRDTIEFFEQTLDRYLAWFRVEPGVVVRDMHPDYLSSRWAEKYSRMKGVRLLDVQHHHAHIASVIFEHRIEEPVIGLSLDGTGYGESPIETQGASMGTPTKGKEEYGTALENVEKIVGVSNGVPRENPPDFHGVSVWGCEMLHVTDAGAYSSRLGHMQELALVGGERAIRNPRMMAAGVVADFFGQDKAIELFGELGERVGAQLDSGLGVVRASSAGRLFDTVAGLLGIVDEIAYEAEGAVALEALASNLDVPFEGYRFGISDDLVLDPKPCLEEIIADIKRGMDKAVIAARFHAGFAGALLHWAVKARDSTGCDIIAASGGVFANRFLLGLCSDKARREGFKFLASVMIPTSDGGLSVGQLQIAAALARIGAVEK